ncbi:MAG: tRNA-dihydrouridine synthase [Deltaproteobacteria bacterium]|jgi:nifR3 family TIM-barrel protein|nr:tRNA-dihydrouridine synthase [Deltaproteobacteria bacterium]
MLKITDTLQLQTPLILAPMSGITNGAFRSLIFRENKIVNSPINVSNSQTNNFLTNVDPTSEIENAVGLMVTEFVSVEALIRNNQRCLQMLKFLPTEKPIAIQIFGYEINHMVQAAKMVEEFGADLLDINCGCPVPKVVRRGGGAELMRQPGHLRKMLSAIKKEIKIPIGVKIRSGWDEAHKNAIEIAKLVEAEGASMLTIHARTKVQGYSGKVDYNIVEEICKSISIPTIGSGDICDIEDAKFYLGLGVRGLMIGRASLKNPWVFKDIFNALCGAVEQESRSYQEIVRILRDYNFLLQNDLPEKAILGRLKQLVAQITKGQVGGTKLRAALCQAKTTEQFFELLC